MKFKLPDQLPATVAELNELADQATAEIRIFQARADAKDDFTPEELERFEYLLDSRDKITAERDTLEASTAEDAEKLSKLLDRSAAETKTAAPDDAAESSDADADGDSDEDGEGGAASDVVAEAEAATKAAAEEPQPVAASAKQSVSFAGATRGHDSVPDAPSGSDDDAPLKRWTMLTSAPKYAELGMNGPVSTREIAEAIVSVQPGQRTGRQATGQRFFEGDLRASQALAKLERPQGKVAQTAEELFAMLDKAASEIPGHGKVSAKALVAAGGWCAPSEQLYDFCPTAAAGNLISLPEAAIKRGGIIFPAEPDFSALQSGFHFTEPELEATDPDTGKPTAIKEFVEIPCPDEMIEYRLEAIGWAVKAGILQKQAWPELIQKFLDEFMVAHQYRVSALTVQKMLGESSAAKLVPTDAVLGATTGILNGLHVRARNLQLKHRIETIEGVAPVWFRDVLRADLANREGKEFLAVSDAEIDSWLAVRGIYLQYEGTWQSHAAGKPGHSDTAWWPDSVDVILYPAGTFFRSLDNVITLGVQYPIEMVQENRYSEGFVEDSFLVGKRCYESHLIRIPLCVNGAVGAREQIVCGTP
ncbi:major capsid protein [Mycolicibacterium goodii]|uniref:Major capsid protein n=1 Tax=Mycolicibacterium goodii TaxID=134601 RepID=A0ABS6HN54_MYCGD|nr:major capsid protein [Mycolicibacterium goodii]MBU8824127.1 major capsid protein [Mycolicibacterium goodii]MBU8838090.1 major capsid protein [Mycolicibacterium goodii]